MYVHVYSSGIVSVSLPVYYLFTFLFTVCFHCLMLLLSISSEMCSGNHELFGWSKTADIVSIHIIVCLPVLAHTLVQVKQYSNKNSTTEIKYANLY